MCGTYKLLNKREPLPSSSASVISVFITVPLILDKTEYDDRILSCRKFSVKSELIVDVVVSIPLFKIYYRSLT